MTKKTGRMTDTPVLDFIAYIAFYMAILWFFACLIAFTAWSVDIFTWPNFRGTLSISAGFAFFFAIRDVSGES